MGVLVDFCTYRSIAATVAGRTPTGINWIIMRYSDVLLMFAEAGYALNGSADMINSVAGISPRQALEAVRQRAFGADSPQVSSYDSDFFQS